MGSASRRPAGRRLTGTLGLRNADENMDRSQLKMDRRRVDALPREVLVNELRKVAAKLGGRRFSRHDFDQHATACKGSAVLSHFGSWAKALSSIGAPLTDYRAERKQVSDGQLLRELARIRSALGHRPSKLEWEASDAAFSYTTYKQRFGGWVSACAALVSGNVETASTTTADDDIAFGRLRFRGRG